MVTKLFAGLGVLGAALTPAGPAWAQATPSTPPPAAASPAPSAPNTQTPNAQTPPNGIARGVVPPPRGVDPEIVTKPPVNAAPNMPVIKPPVNAR